MEQTPQPTNGNAQLIDIRPNTLVQVVLLGIILGAASWLLTVVIDRFVVGVLVCGGQGVTCDNSTVIAGNIALVLTAVGGLLGLVRLGVYRPLLVVIAAAIVLWGLSGYVLGMQWYEAMAWTVLLSAVTYVTFTWLVRPRFFLIAIILVLVVVILARILPALS